MLEAAHLGNEVRALAAPLLLRARRSRKRADELALEALLAAINDQLDEINNAGLSLCQLATLWNDNTECGR
jgi:hypothetical protein